jgi:two-component system, OmpR family, sensor histidine kinase VicK
MDMTITKHHPVLQTMAGDMGFWSIDIMTKEIFLCDRARVLIGIKDQMHINCLTILKLIAPTHRLTIIKLIRRACASGQRFQYEYPVCTEPSGEPTWLQISGQTQPVCAPEAVKFSGTLVDITAEKQKWVLREDLLAMLSHELKTPLSTIKLYVQMVGNMAKKSNDLLIADLLCKADNQVTEMTSVIENILDISLIASGRATLQTRHFDMDLLIREVICSYFYLVKTHNIRLSNEGEQLVCADRSKIKQVILNLLSNAIKYSPEQSEIIINCRSGDDRLQVSVHDRGMGISPVHLEKLFKRFYRAECDEVKNKKGYGIGLYIVKEIIQQHRGEVWVESVEGSGAVFHFSLPIK